MSTATLATGAAAQGAACERCHKYKEKCTYAGLDKSCVRCLKLKRECVLRVKKRMGRPPVAKSASSTILDVGTRPMEAANTPDTNTMILVTQTMSSRKSNWQHAAFESRGFPFPRSLFAIQQSPLSQNIKHVIGSVDGFQGFHRFFMLGETFTSLYQSATLVIYDLAPQVFSNAYYATMSALFDQNNPGLRDNELTLAASCLRYLVKLSSSINCVGDAAVVIMLGQIMLVYNSLIPNPYTRTITKSTLLATKEWYPQLLKEPSFDSITLAPVFVDTVDCLFRREVPVVQIPNRNMCTVDRLLGISAPLFSYIHDLCVVSHECKVKGITPCAEHDPYTDVEERISSWVPEWPPDLFTTFSPLEATKIVAQAQNFRLGALLIIHRLRYPLGVEDDAAAVMADEIILLLSRLAKHQGDCATGLGLDFPLLVAMIEKPGPGSEVDEAFVPLRYRQHGESRQLSEFVKFVTDARRAGYSGLWLDLVHDGLHGVFIP
ncbi:unnamed protein product [Clonostachys rhizophaga]|uniref:Zn(2)-C6 fungal-type domain-containing protein n=1 Tax=Clonostachys rhizophaga TaxID=160324 RepID=A0A9N9V688_9HYPO|nr:unnamed protein product [Clonostachys rhizophaga]